MGGCCSRPAVAPTPQIEPAVGIAELRLFPRQQLPSGAQIGLSTAGWVATLPFCGFSVVHADTSFVFVAIFDGEEDSTAAAAHTCRQHVLAAFTSCASAANGDMREALRKAFAELDNLVAGGRKRMKGASSSRSVQRSAGVMVVFDLRSGVCYTAAAAAARSAAVLCSVLGAFNAESAEGHFLGQPDRREAGPLPRGHGTGGVVVTAQKLSFQHKQIVVASRGFLELVTADEVALRLHSMRKAGGTGVSKAGFTERGPAATSPASSGNSIGSSRSSNMAETLVLYAMGKLAAKLDRAANGANAGDRQLRPPSVATPLSQRVSLGDLQSLRFQGGPLTDGASTLASLTGASSTADGHDEWPNKRRLLASVTRRQLHRDVAAVVIDIDWGDKSPGAGHAAAGRTGGWATAKALCTFDRLRRTRLRERWWAAADQLLADGRKRARQLEQSIWHKNKLVVTVTPSGKIVDSCGNLLSVGSPAMAMHVTC